MTASVGIAQHPRSHVIMRFDNGCTIDHHPSGQAYAYAPGGAVLNGAVPTLAVAVACVARYLPERDPTPTPTGPVNAGLAGGMNVHA